MNKVKAIILQCPEYILILSVVFYWVSAAIIINPVAIVLLGLLILQIIFQNKFIGITIAIFLILISLYMLAALMSEFSEFPTFNSEAKTFLFVGLTYFISTIMVAGLMIYKYVSANSSMENSLDLHG